MEPRKCLKFNDLTVYPDGRIFDPKQNRFLHNYAGTTSRKGPVVYYYDGIKSHQLSRMVMVYEAFIKEGIIDRGEFIDTIDGDSDNVHYSNLYLRKKGSTTHRTDYYENESICGWNGISEVYC
jgi:hypothetical protein